MDPELLDVVRPLLVMGGAITLVMLCRELHVGWAEAAALKRIRQQAQDRQKPRQEEGEAEEE